MFNVIIPSSQGAVFDFEETGKHASDTATVGHSSGGSDDVFFDGHLKSLLRTTLAACGSHEHGQSTV